jgi:hypothetical protein
MIKTFGSVFPETMLWKVTKSLDLILVGGLTPTEATPGDVERRVAEMHQERGGVPEVQFVLSRDAQQVREIVSRPEVPVHTDDRPRLEFRAAESFLLGDPARREERER